LTTWLQPSAIFTTKYFFKWGSSVFFFHSAEGGLRAAFNELAWI